MASCINNAFSVNMRYSMRLKEYGSFDLTLVHFYIKVCKSLSDFATLLRILI